MDALFDPSAPEFLANPYPAYARLRAEAPVYRHPMGFYCVSRYEDVQHVLRTPELFSSAAMGGASPRISSDGLPVPASGALIAQDPPAHTDQRKIVARGFTPRHIARLEPRIRELTRKLVSELRARGHGDLIANLASPLPVIVIAELLGLDPSRHEEFKRWSTSLVIGSTSGGFRRNEQDRQNLVAFRDFMVEHIERRRAEPGDDLVSTLIHAEKEDGILTADQVFAFATLLLVAGSETTTNLIGNAVLAALANKDQLAAVRAEPVLLRDFIEETLRYDPPVQLVNRLTTQPVVLVGQDIPAGAFVMALLGSANRDPERFADPDRFDLTRDSSAHLGFGFGHHYCLGASLARLESRIALEAVFFELGELTLETPTAERHASFLVRGPRSLPLRFGR